ncbi:hypothetical protein EV356DRAFT_27725 [Viridothelium virens]|uniref:Uncharacterized protein n=1 Tax=Viridothelium virens TaxID=1048519 RepID=A0A6A6HI11_VIRVR|nr:hypothetical protein EV356DRAFT_27725 [Viridothelium virens]
MTESEDYEACLKVEKPVDKIRRFRDTQQITTKDGSVKNSGPSGCWHVVWLSRTATHPRMNACGSETNGFVSVPDSQVGSHGKKNLYCMMPADWCLYVLKWDQGPELICTQPKCQTKVPLSQSQSKSLRSAQTQKGPKKAQHHPSLDSTVPYLSFPPRLLRHSRSPCLQEPVGVRGLEPW